MYGKEGGEQDRDIGADAQRRRDDGTDPAVRKRDFQPQMIDERLLDDLRQLVRLAVREDLDNGIDLTTLGLVPQAKQGRAHVVARVAGVLAGVDLIPAIVDELNADIEGKPYLHDGNHFDAGKTLVTLVGSTRDLLTCERTILNFLGRLCGIATWTNQFVSRIGAARARLYDTRKTTPGWRRLEKYATRCGGACNHRSGLYDAVLIKDNHLACRASVTGSLLDPAAAVTEVRSFLSEGQFPAPSDPMIEIEVDSIEQLAQALKVKPDIVLLDNMSCSELKACVALRDELAPGVELEASGGVRLDTIAEIASTGVERISVGALTHSAVNLDLGLDWELE